MLSRQENDLLTRVGPGTPGGEFMRRYWQPIALAEELPSEGPPIAVRLLGEDLGPKPCGWGLQVGSRKAQSVSSGPRGNEN